MIRNLILFVLFFMISGVASAEGIVSRITAAPIHPNGIVKDVRAGVNIHLQSDAATGLDFMDPTILGYGLPPGGTLEIELLEGFQRDPAIVLDEKTILLVAGAPQQGLPGQLLGFTVREGSNPYTYVIGSDSSDGVSAENLISPAPGAAFDPIRQRGIKIIHIGRTKAFVVRGTQGRIDVRFKDAAGSIIASGEQVVSFLQEPRPQLYPTNIPHDQRNHNWQRVEAGKILGVASKTLPLPLLLYDKNDNLNNRGLDGVGVLSAQQLSQLSYELPEPLRRYNGGLILQDTNADGRLDPNADLVIGGIRNTFPEGQKGGQILTPLVNEKPFLSVETGLFNEKAGASIGGSIMQVVFIAGDKKGLYRSNFALLEKPGDVNSPDGSSFTYTTVVE